MNSTSTRMLNQISFGTYEILEIRSRIVIKYFIQRDFRHLIPENSHVGDFGKLHLSEDKQGRNLQGIECQWVEGLLHHSERCELANNFQDRCRTNFHWNTLDQRVNFPRDIQ